MDRIKAYLQDNRQRFLDELCTWLRFASVSAQRARDEQTLACATWIKDRLSDLGLEARLSGHPKQPVVFAVCKGRSDRQLVIYGHYDVQPEDPVDQWATKPFEPVIKDDHIYARGTSDDKGQVFAHVMALDAILNTGATLPCTTVFLLEGQEESGGDVLTNFIASAQQLQPQAVVVSDSSMYDKETPALTYGLRGIVAMEITVKGPAKDVHSGTYGGAVANPVIVLARILASCQGPDSRILIQGFYDDVLALQDWEKQNIRSLRYDETALLNELEVPALFGEPGYSTLERIWARPTFEVNGLVSGYTGQGSKTIIPSSATAKISLRLVPNQDPEKVRQQVRDHITRLCPPYVHLGISTIHASQPVLFDIQHPAMRKAVEALKVGFGKEPVFVRCGGSIPIVTEFVRSWSCPVLLMGFGQDSDGAHSPNEHFSIKSLFNGAVASAYLLQNF